MHHAYDYERFGQPREDLAYYRDPERDRANLEAAANLQATLQQRAD